MGRLNAARLQAEEIVLPELILPAPSTIRRRRTTRSAGGRPAFYEDLRRIRDETDE